MKTKKAPTASAGVDLLSADSPLLSPIQKNMKRANALCNKIDHLQFVISVMTALPNEYTAAEVEKQIAFLIKAQDEYIENARERIGLYR